MVDGESENMKGALNMDLHKTDPEFIERFEHFALEEVPGEENHQTSGKNTLYGNSCDPHRVRRN